MPEMRTQRKRRTARRKFIRKGKPRMPKELQIHCKYQQRNNEVVRSKMALDLRSHTRGKRCCPHLDAADAAIPCSPPQRHAAAQVGQVGVCIVPQEQRVNVQVARCGQLPNAAWHSSPATVLQCLDIRNGRQLPAPFLARPGSNTANTVDGNARFKEARLLAKVATPFFFLSIRRDTTRFHRVSALCWQRLRVELPLSVSSRKWGFSSAGFCW